MKKVFIVHGFQGSPNGGWRPWLMAELEKIEVYACALSMPTPENPICSEWVAEIARHVERNKNDEIYLVGHSLGVPAIMRYLESADSTAVAGCVLVSGPSEKNSNKKLDLFLDTPFDFEKIKSTVMQFAIIHGDNDDRVPFDNAEMLAEKLNGELIMIPNGGHLNGRSGWLSLPQALEALNKMFVK